MSERINYIKEPLSDSFILLLQDNIKGFAIIEDKTPEIAALFYLCKIKGIDLYEKILFDMNVFVVYEHYKEKIKEE